MSNLNTEQQYDDYSESIGFILEQFKKGLKVCIPAIVQSYDSNTKRATVLPAIKQLFTDNTSLSMPLLLDIPVLFPSSAQYTLVMPILNGDCVLLIVSERGISNFKKKYEESLPTNSLMSIEDAVAIAGFGALNITPATTTGCSMQNNSGVNAVIIEADKVSIIKGSNSISVLDSEIKATVSGASLTLTASSLISTVPIIAPSFGGDAGGAANMTSGINMAGQSILGANVIESGGVNLTTHKHVDSEGGNTGTPIP